jgi:hypothetical protein
VAAGKLTNPVTGATLLSQFKGTATGSNMAYKTLVMSCSAACELIVQRSTARGTTCTLITVQNLQIGNNGTQQAPTADDTVENGCTGAPTLTTTLYDLNLGAGIPVNLDLAGFVNFHNVGGGSGINVAVVTGFTGVASASLTWVEQ